MTTKRLLLVVAIWLCLSIGTMAQTPAPISGWCEKGGQTVTTNGIPSSTYAQKSYPSCTVTVYTYGTASLATIYSDTSSTPQANPFTASSIGQWQFFGLSGSYTVQLSSGGISSPFNIGSYTIGSGSGGGSGTVTSVAMTVPTFLSIAGSPVTTTGTLAVSLSGTALPVANGGTGATTLTGVLHGNGISAVTASNVNLASEVTGNLPVTNLNSGTSATASTFWRGDGTWATPSAGAGTVTSVAQSFTGGLISVAGSPVTTTGTLALTVAGTSGGIPYFSTGSTWASSGALTSNALVLGGGAGASPAVVAGLTTDGTSKLTLGVAGASVGSIDFKNATSGTVNLAPTTGALGSSNIMLPALSGTVSLQSTTLTSTRVPISGASGILADDADLTFVTDTLTFTKGAATTSLTVAGAAITNNVVQNSQSAAYTTVLADAGKHIYHPSADTTARIWTIDSNANVPYPIGTQIIFINDCSAGVVTISITTDTMVLFTAGTTGNRSLAACGIATATKVTSTRWVIFGSGLT